MLNIFPRLRNFYRQSCTTGSLRVWVQYAASVESRISTSTSVYNLQQASVTTLDHGFEFHSDKNKFDKAMRRFQSVAKSPSKKLALSNFLAGAKNPILDYNWDDAVTDLKINQAPSPPKTSYQLAASEIHRNELLQLMAESTCSGDLEKIDANGWTPLIRAAQYNLNDIVKSLLNKGAQVNANSAHGPALLRAVENGNIELVRILLQNGASLELAGVQGNTPLLAAARLDHCPIVQLLLDHGANPNAENVHGWTPFNTAAFYGFTDIVKCMINFCKSNFTSKSPKSSPSSSSSTTTLASASTSLSALLNKKTDAVGTALHRACEVGHLAVVDLLVRAGAHLESTHNGTPLLRACERRHLEVAQRLLQAGANPDAKTRAGTALIRVVELGDEPLARLLLSYGAQPNLETPVGTALHRAAARGNCRMVQLLVQNGANVQAEWAVPTTKNSSSSSTTTTSSSNSTPVYLETPLIVAAKHGNVDVVKLLLDLGAAVEPSILQAASLSPSTSSSSSSLPRGMRQVPMTALWRAVEAGQWEVTKLLLQKGANASFPHAGGVTPLHLAASQGSAELVQLLLDYGHVDVDIANAQKATPLIEAAGQGRLSVVKCLVESKANLESRNVLGWTPLLAAIVKGRTEVVKYLLDTGADWRAMDVRERSALALATEYHHEAIVQLLMKLEQEHNTKPEGVIKNKSASVKQRKMDLDVQFYLRGGSSSQIFM